MLLYRYNCERSLRRFNRCGKEKNPNQFKYYSKTLEYANEYKNIYDSNGYLTHTCELEIIEIEIGKLFNMVENFRQLEVYKNYIKNDINQLIEHYTSFKANAKLKREQKRWDKLILELLDGTRETQLINGLKSAEFQYLSDFENQNQLLAELKTLDYSGYETKKEVVIL